MADNDTPHVDPPREARRCVVCGATAYYGFGPPGALPADAWYCSEHLEEGEQAWAKRYGTRPSGPSGGRLMR
jgi:hypothetical protein